jgi:outer membrane protein OmpA-like peptidoglycan-associated protein
MMRGSGIALLIPALILAGAGCATKGFVREAIGQSQAKVDAQISEQNGRVEEQARRTDAQSKSLEDMGGRFTKIETSVDEFGNIARSASTKADDAAQRAEEASTRVSRLLANRNKRTVVETINVQFGFDHADLTDAARTALAELIKELAENPTLVVDLEGYTDSLGPVEHNLRLSERRVETVRRFLVAHGVDLPRINWIGMGEASDTGAKADPKNRRVTVRLLVPADEVSPPRSKSAGDETSPPQSGSKAGPDEASTPRSDGVPPAPAEATSAPPAPTDHASAKPAAADEVRATAAPSDDAEGKPKRVSQ